MSALTPGFVLNLDGEEHHAVRKLINPVFNTKSTNGRKTWSLENLFFFFVPFSIGFSELMFYIVKRFILCYTLMSIWL